VNEFLTLFTRASKLLREAADQSMGQHGVRVGQNIVLEALWEEDGLTPGEVAGRIDVTTPTVVNTATRMELAGLLERRPDPHDARLVRLFLTRRARAVRTAVERERDELEQRATANLTPAERRQLNAALRKIVRTLEGVPEADRGA